ncbi:acyltransferase family protein [uncultured Ilumatobacter sp.]|uniref:acyltransferase family protein n=1 Tax=uncultured Ilumatobacter sp. TaxID=879968 RepID=UPI00374F33D4
MSVISAPDAAPAPRRMDANISKVPYLPGLDGMRAVAVVAVMIYHANSTWLKGGFIGVEVFFVISGYLITLLLIAEHEKTGAVDMKNFWVRRFRRLLPALFVMLLLLSIWTAIFERDALGQLRGDLLGGVFYISNWYQVFIGAGYSASNDFAPLRHLWSLAVEEQFYFIWPIVMVALLRKGSRRIADLSVWLFGAAVFVTVVVAVLYHPGPIDADPSNTPAAYWEIGGRFISKGDALYLSTLSRSSGLLLGAAFAMVWRPVAMMRGPLQNKAHALDGLAVVGFAILALMSWKVGFIDTFGDNSADPWLFRGGFFVAGIATLLIIAAVTHRDSLTAKALSGPTMLWIGTRSYGLYLYHWPIYQIVRNTAGTKLKFHEWVLCMVATAIITEISYRYIETPIRKGQLAAIWQRRGQQSRRSQNRGAVLGGAFFGTALAIFAGASLATAELKQNAVDESLKQSAGATCSVLLGTCNGVPEASTGPEIASTLELAPVASDGSDTPAEGIPETTVETSVPLPAAPEKFAIGDSVMLGAADELKAAGFIVDATESRAFVRGIDVVQALSDRSQLPQELVIHLGTNGPISNDQMDMMMRLVANVPKVLLIQNVVPDGTYDEDNNLIMINVASSLANVEVLYWDGLAQQCQGDCIYQDGIHLKSTGAAYYTTLIETVLADGSLFS